MKRKSRIAVVCLSLLLWCGCKKSWFGEHERRDFEVAMYFEFKKSSLEHLATLDALIEKGEIESARKMIRTGIFLDLQELDQLTDMTFQSKFGRTPLAIVQEDLEEEVFSKLTKYYTESIVDAGQQYVRVPSDITYMEESREFLEKMSRLGLPNKDRKK